MRVEDPRSDAVAPPWHESLSDEFHVATRNTSTVKRFYKAHEIHYSAEVKELTSSAPEKLAVGKALTLHAPLADLAMPLGDAIKLRRSGRQFAQSPIDPSDLQSLLFYSCGVRSVSQMADTTPIYHRNVASSGNLGSCEIFVIAHNVSGLSAGIYHFDSGTGSLGLIRHGSYRSWLQERVLYQIELASAAALLVFVGAVGRLKTKYGERGYRLALIDAGHVSQNAYLICTALGLTVTATAGFIDEELDRALNLDGLDYASLLTMAIGNPADAAR
jgi:SagB-type dehydrogenase family enzyme